MEQNHTKSFVIVFIVGVLIGLGLSFAFTGSSMKGGSYQAGFDAAKKLVQDSQLGAMILPQNDIRGFSGTVTAVNGNRVSVHGQASNDPFADQSFNDRVVIITKDTKISALTQKDPKVFSAEMDAFMRNGSRLVDGKPTSPPTMFNTAPSDVSNIKVGSSINVAAGENIKTMKEFNATEVQINTK